MTRLLAKLVPSAVIFWYALPALAIQTGLEETAKKAYGDTLPEADISVIVGRVISAALGLLGIVFLVLTVYGGFLWMTAAGNEQQIEKAKKMLVSAVIGLVIVSAGYAIANFVITQLTTAVGV